MKIKGLIASLLFCSLITLTTIGVEADETSIKDTSQVKTESTESSSKTETSVYSQASSNSEDGKETNRSINNSPNSDMDIEQFYNYAISTGKINRDLYSLDAFNKNYRSSLEEFPETKKNLNLNIDFKEWFEQINFGAFPDGEGHAFDEKQTELGGPIPRSGATMSAAQRKNANRFKSDLRKGDIVIVNGNPGHAAIATTNGYLLEMSGGGNINSWLNTGIENNNHQFSAENWLAGNWEQGARTGGNGQLGYIKHWIQIYRVPDKKIAEQVANYADKHYWNSKGGYQKNINLKYLIRADLYSINPNYCSKLVYNAFWYGSGSSPVMKSYQNYSLIYPSGLIGTFNSSYKPYKVGTY